MNIKPLNLLWWIGLLITTAAALAAIALCAFRVNLSPRQCAALLSVVLIGLAMLLVTTHQRTRFRPWFCR